MSDPVGPPSAPSNEAIKNLSDLALFISLPVTYAMQAAYVTYVAEGWFHQFDGEEQRRRFRSHPANCLQFAALSALEDRSIVTIAGTLEDPNRIFPHGTEIRRVRDLYLHRHALSHPTLIKWGNKSMIPFVAAGRPLYDWRAALVWDLQRSINDELRKHGQETRNETILVTPEMGLVLHNILDSARQPDYLIPDAALAFKALQLNLDSFVRTLEKHPDGQVRDPEDMTLMPPV